MVNSLKFVDTIASSPTTLLDLNDSSTYYLDGFDAPPPRLRRAQSSTMLVDGDVVSAAAYEPRVVRMSWKILGTSDVTGLAVQNISRQLDKPTNLLRWLPQGATNPMFFRVRRSDYSNIEERHNVNGVRSVEAELLCEPFAYGLREDLTAVVIAGDPVAGTNPLAATLGTVKGDVATPAYVYVASGGTTVGDVHMLGIDHGAATTGTPPADQAEGNTYGTDTALQAQATGSGGNAARSTFATNIFLTKRVTAIRVPTTEVGTYRLFARIRPSTTNASVFRMRYVETVSGVDIQGDIVRVTTSVVAWLLIDLGLWQFPAGTTLAENGLTGVKLGRDTDAVGALEVARDSGTASLDIDYITAIPGYGDLSFITANTTASFTSIVWDGPGDTVAAITGTPFAAPTVKTGVLFAVEGGLPRLWPGQVNRLWWIYQLGASNGLASGTAHDITSSTTLNVSYWPRYLYVRPLST